LDCAFDPGCGLLLGKQTFVFFKKNNDSAWASPSCNKTNGMKLTRAFPDNKINVTDTSPTTTKKQNKTKKRSRATSLESFQVRLILPLLYWHLCKYYNQSTRKPTEQRLSISSSNAAGGMKNHALP